MAMGGINNHTVVQPGEILEERVVKPRSEFVSVLAEQVGSAGGGNKERVAGEDQP